MAIDIFCEGYYRFFPIGKRNAFSSESKPFFSPLQITVQCVSRQQSTFPSLHPGASPGPHPSCCPFLSPALWPQAALRRSWLPSSQGPYCFSTDLAGCSLLSLTPGLLPALSERPAGEQFSPPRSSVALYKPGPLLPI